jgi:hypothetical protein
MEFSFQRAAEMKFSFQPRAEMKNNKFDHTAQPPIIHLSLSARPPAAEMEFSFFQQTAEMKII